MRNCERVGQLQWVRATETLKTSHRPNGKCLVDMSISILIFDDGCCLDLPVWSTCHLRLKNQKFPSPPWETHVLLVFTGRRCLCLFRHRHNDVLLDHRQHSFWIGACSCGNFPSPRWDFHMFRALCLQGGGVRIYSGTVTFSLCTITGNTAGYVRAHAQKFPSPRWESC